MTQYTANENLYKWSASDTKQTTITETASNAEKIDAKLNDHTAQLAERVKQTVQPLELYVSPTGSPNNDGLSSSTAFDKISTALSKLPRTLFHEVVIYVANGTYTEDSHLDEWGRKAGLYLNDIVVHPVRVPTNATFPTKKSHSMNSKGAKLFIVGESMDGVIIQGRPDGVAYDSAIHPKYGICSRLRDIYIENMTIKNYDINLMAHEGGKIAGANIKIRNANGMGILVESMHAKIELSYLDLSVSAQSYCVYILNGQLTIDNSTIENGTNTAAILTENSQVLVVDSTIKSIDSSVRGGVYGQASHIDLDGCTLDKVECINKGGLLLIDGCTAKNASTAFGNYGGFMAVTGGSHIFDNQVGVYQESGNLDINQVDSMDGATQKYNSVAGVQVVGGHCNYSPYSVSTLGFNLKGQSGKPQTDVVHKNLRVLINNKPQITSTFSETGWQAGSLGGELNNFLNNINSPNPSNTVSTLYTSLKTVSNLGSFYVSDCNGKLTEIVNALVASGYISQATANAKYILTGMTDDVSGHDRVKNAFNQLLTDLANWGLMQP